NLAVRRLETARARRLGVEVGSQFRAVGSKRMNLRGKRIFAVVSLAAPVSRSFQRVKRGGKTPACCVDRARIGHGRLPASCGCRTNVAKFPTRQSLDAKRYGARPFRVNVLTEGVAPRIAPPIIQRAAPQVQQSGDGSGPKIVAFLSEAGHCGQR